jgi:creatinine amidohydrolase
MRTRCFDALTNDEITAYLRHNDLIYIPVGTVEMHGAMPVGAEYVLPLAFAHRFAEETDGLILPHLIYFYPGATAIGRGTIHVSPSGGVAYLKEISHSLCRQGFRRQIFLTAHGPAHVTLATVVREVFEETHCIALYLDLVRYLDALDFDLSVWGAYQQLGRLDDIPLDQQPVVRTPHPEALAKLGRPGVQVGWFFSDETQHGWWPPAPLTPEQRQERAEQGLVLLESVAAGVGIKGIAEGMRDLDKYIQNHVLPKHEDRLP